MKIKPSIHFMLLIALTGLALVGFGAIITAGHLRGYTPNMLIAFRDALLFLPLLGVFFWLIRIERCRGDLILFTAMMTLFTLGTVAQYRLFSDPEYGARHGNDRSDAREAKMQSIRMRNLKSGYDDVKLQALFGTTDREHLPEPKAAALDSKFTFGQVLTSEFTYMPLLGILAFAVAYAFLKRDDILLMIQRSSLLIGIATLIPFTLAVFFLARAGKIFGTTPWEPVKILFLFSFAGILADNYRGLSRTTWGLPAGRFLLPLVAVAMLPALPFFALSDFGQMLVFYGVYILLFFVTVRRTPIMVYGSLMSLLFLPIFYFGVGLPNRVRLRFYLWWNLWQPPAPDTAWWQPFLVEIQRAYRNVAVPNEDAWFDQSSQLAQGLFGITRGHFFGTGLGLGFPEVVPVSDSDFIYAAIGEELGFFGGILLVLALLALILTGLKTAIESRDMFTKLLAAGLTGFLGLQAIVNIGGVIRLLPMTGITLPFVSHGGSSLVTSFVMVGILLAISHRNEIQRQKEKQKDEATKEETGLSVDHLVHAG